MVKFTVYGEPKAKGRPRVSVRKSGDGEKTFARAYTPKQTVIYENQVKLEYENQCGSYRFPDDAMLDIRIFAYYGIPKSTSKKKRELMLAGKIRPTKKPDFDNIAKIICDSLNGIAYQDDKLIVDGMFRKFYSEQPRVEVKILQIRLLFQQNHQSNTAVCFIGCRYAGDYPSTLGRSDREEESGSKRVCGGNVEGIGIPGTGGDRKDRKTKPALRRTGCMNMQT